jgi:tRNA (guanine6-N2)-methyltransferase
LRPRPGRRATPDRAPADFEAEVIGGLEPFAARELTELGVLLTNKAASSRDIALTPAAPKEGRRQVYAATEAPLRFGFAGPWRRLLELRTAVAVHAVVADRLPRPTALLDDGTFRRLVAAVGHIRSLHPARAFATIRLSAAGADSPTFRRLRERLSEATGLRDVPDGGDLLLRFKRAPVAVGARHAAPSGLPNRSAGGPGTPRPYDAGAPSFELTARISPRPLSARTWRVCNLPGALNATVAAAMAGLAEPSPDDTYLNLACGSGTLLIERAALGPARRLLGCDLDPRALGCAAENVAAAGLPNVELHAWDAGAVPLPSGSATALVADLPFGQLVGSHAANEQLYPRILGEAARLARAGARFVAISQQVNLFERSLAALRDAWTLERVVRLDLPANAGVLKPRVYVLRRFDTQAR